MRQRLRAYTLHPLHVSLLFNTWCQAAAASHHSRVNSACTVLYLCCLQASWDRPVILSQGTEAVRSTLLKNSDQAGTGPKHHQADNFCIDLSTCGVQLASMLSKNCMVAQKLYSLPQGQSCLGALHQAGARPQHQHAVCFCTDLATCCLQWATPGPQLLPSCSEAICLS